MKQATRGKQVRAAAAAAVLLGVRCTPPPSAPANLLELCTDLSKVRIDHKGLLCWLERGAKKNGVLHVSEGGVRAAGSFWSF
eukprot:436155-Pelagomonas_calceolata.AAC.1